MTIRTVLLLVCLTITAPALFSQVCEPIIEYKTVSVDRVKTGYPEFQQTSPPEWKVYKKLEKTFSKAWKAYSDVSGPNFPDISDHYDDVWTYEAYTVNPDNYTVISALPRLDCPAINAPATIVYAGRTRYYHRWTYGTQSGSDSYTTTMDANGNWLDPFVAQLPFAWGCDGGTEAITVTPTSYRTSWSNGTSDAFSWTMCYGYREDKLSLEYTTADLISKLSGDLASAAYSDWIVGQPFASFHLTSYKACGTASKFKARIRFDAPDGFDCTIKYTIQKTLNGVATSTEHSGMASKVGAYYILNVPEQIPTGPEEDIVLLNVRGFFSVSDLSVSSPSGCDYYVFDPVDPNKATVLVPWISLPYNRYVTLQAFPTPSVQSESELPDCWSLTGGLVANKTLTFVDRWNTGITTVRAESECDYKERQVIIYKAIFRVFANEGNRSGFDTGHAWWQFQLQPASVINYVDPLLREYIDFGGYWPIGFTVPTPAELRFGTPDAQGGNGETESGAWTLCLTDFINGLDYVDDWKTNPGYWTYFGNQCSSVAVDIAQFLGISGLNGATPWDLHDSLIPVPDDPQ